MFYFCNSLLLRFNYCSFFIGVLIAVFFCSVFRVIAFIVFDLLLLFLVPLLFVLLQFINRSSVLIECHLGGLSEDGFR